MYPHPHQEGSQKWCNVRPEVFPGCGFSVKITEIWVMMRKRHFERFFFLIMPKNSCKKKKKKKEIYQY